jgi:phage I-like protein
MLKISECAFNSDLIQEKTLQLLPYADFKGIDGRPTTETPHLNSWKINGVIAEKIIQAAKNVALKIPIDWEHSTEKKAPNGEYSPAAGFFKRMEWREGQGLFAVDVDWTEKALNDIKQKHYKYISPVFSFHTSSGEIARIKSVGLTNNPNLIMNELSLNQAQPTYHLLPNSLDSLNTEEKRIADLFGNDYQDVINQKIEDHATADQRQAENSASDNPYALNTEEKRIADLFGNDYQDVINQKIENYEN